MYGLLCKLLENEGKQGAFIKTHIFIDWINAAKVNDALPGHKRVFFNRDSPHKPLPYLHL